MGKQERKHRSSAEPIRAATSSRGACLAWNGSQHQLKLLLRGVLDAEHISLTELANQLKLPLAHVSRWLKDREGPNDQLPLGILSQICRILKLVPVIGLIKRKPDADGSLRLPSPPLLREFFFGVGCSVNFADGPSAVARHIADAWGAKSWSMYTEDPRRNVLEWTGGGPQLENSELMYGPSYSSELPIQVLQRVQTSSERQSYVKYDWPPPDASGKGQQSSFAAREGVACCMGIPLQGDGLRTTVLFLNFAEQPAADALDHEIVAMAANELRGLVQQVWSMPELRGTMQRGDLAFSSVLGVLGEAFQGAAGETLNGPTSAALTASCLSLWPGKDKQCTVHALRQSVLYQEEGDPKFQGSGEPDDMVRRAARFGENFYITDLALADVRGRFDPRNRVPRRQVQKLVVPIRCEEFLDGIILNEAAGRAEAKNSQRVLQCLAPRKNQVRSWGAISVDANERCLQQSNSLELSVLAHLTAIGCYLRSKAAGDPKARRFYGPLFAAIQDTIAHVKKLKGGGADPKNDPLDPLCKAVVMDRLFDSAERCAIYPYDHVLGQFGKGGSFVHADWIEELSPGLRDKLKQGPNKLKYLEPRKGGNSERMLGLVDEYHIIGDAKNHPRVSPVTKMMDTASLIGCSCRIGASLRSDCVLWLGSRKSFPLDYLQAEGGLMLDRLRVLAHVAAVFCVALRWWGHGAGRPDPLDHGT